MHKIKKRFNMLFFRRKIGFTLTEILIVVVIVGILAALALPMFLKTIEKVKVGEAISNLNLIRTGEKIYYLEYGGFSPTIVPIGADGFVGLNIENPNEPTSCYFDYTIQSADSDDFTARAQRKSTAPTPYSTYYYEIQKDGTITSNGSPLI